MGITLHEFLTGRRPFDASQLQAFRYIQSEHHSNLSQFKDNLKLDYLDKCDFISYTCKDFIRRLLVVDVSI